MTQGLLQLIHLGKEECFNHIFSGLLQPVHKINELRCQHFNPGSGKKRYRKNLIDDGVIYTDSYELLIESKAVKAAVNPAQLQKQKVSVLTKQILPKKLLYITPDIICPKPLENCDNVFWMSWDNVLSRLRSFKTESKALEYLIDCYALMAKKQINANPLGCNIDELVVILAVGKTHLSIREKNEYRCKANRFLHNTKHLAFYFNQKIGAIYTIKEGPVPISEDDVIYRLCEYKEINIPNDLYLNKKKSKKKAFTRGQPRYATLQMLQQAKFTSELSDMIENYKSQTK